MNGFTHSVFVKGNSARHCFISLPLNLCSFVNKNVTVSAFSLESSSIHFGFSWNGSVHETTSEDICVGMNSHLMKVLDFGENELMVIKQLSPPPFCNEITVQIDSAVEWEDLILNMEEAQQSILNQVRIVKIGQCFPIWLEGGAVVHFKVLNLSPNCPFVALQEDTRMKVLPPEEDAALPSVPLKLTKGSQNEDNVNEINSVQGSHNLLHSAFFIFIHSVFGNYYKSLIDTRKNIYLNLRVHPFPSNHAHNKILETIIDHPTAVIISREVLNHSVYKNEKYFTCKIKKITCFKDVNSSIDKKDNNSDGLKEFIGDVYVAVLVWENLNFDVAFISENLNLYRGITDSLTFKSCIISPCLRRRLSIKVKDRISLSNSDNTVSNENGIIDIVPLGDFAVHDTSLPSVLHTKLNKICDNFPIILNPITLIELDLAGKKTDILIDVRAKKSLYLNSVSVKVLQINLSLKNNSKPFIHKYLDSLDATKKERFSLKIYCDLIEKIKSIILDNLVTEKYLNLPPQFLLLEGPKGSGKTSLLKNLVSELSGMKHFIFSHFIELKLFKGKKVETIEKLLMNAVCEAIFHEPSLIILDDLDFLVPEIKDEQNTASIEHYTNVALMMKSIFQQLMNSISLRSQAPIAHPSKAMVTVLATCSSIESVNNILVSPQGKHIFTQTFYIQHPSEDAKYNIFKELLMTLHCEEYSKNNPSTSEAQPNEALQNNVITFSKKIALQKLSNLGLHDINTLASRTFSEAVLRSNKNIFKKPTNECVCDVRFREEDLLNAAKDFIPLSHKDLRASEESKEIIHIGGLITARQVLEETIEWPSKYPHLFSQSALRLRSGILLYGPPGCGKTLLVKYVAQKTHLNFVTVKGPELLSKYIGESERAVRDAFQKAQFAKPCLLFFDEFDSIAPRRGHDRTGVTDRVVNQLLTQMDGVEGLSGVFILAATSRPDLIDPALLRPGRFDKCIYCPLPDEKERLHIFKEISNNLTLEGEIDWTVIAKRTDGYSGADLQGILSTSQIKAAQEFLGTSLYDGVTLNGEEVAENPECDKDYKKNSPSTVPVKENNLFEALSESRPSIKDSEKVFYDELYTNFLSIRDTKVFSKITPGKLKTMA